MFVIFLLYFLYFSLFWAWAGAETLTDIEATAVRANEAKVFAALKSEADANIAATGGAIKAIYHKVAQKMSTYFTYDKIYGPVAKYDKR